VAVPEFKEHMMMHNSDEEAVAPDLEEVRPTTRVTFIGGEEERDKELVRNQVVSTLV
jgi:hypothetical protein